MTICSSPFLPFFFLLRTSLLYWECLKFLQIAWSVLKHLLVTEMQAALFWSVLGDQSYLKCLPTVKPLALLMACNDVQLNKWNLLLKSGWSLPSVTNCLKAEHTSVFASHWICIGNTQQHLWFTAKFHSNISQLFLKIQKQRLICGFAQCLRKYSAALPNLEKRC